MDPSLIIGQELNDIIHEVTGPVKDICTKREHFKMLEEGSGKDIIKFPPVKDIERCFTNVKPDFYVLHVL